MDPLKHTTTFIREFLFIYGSQPRNFFTQHQEAGLLTASQERNMLRESAQAYHATHVKLRPTTQLYYLATAASFNTARALGSAGSPAQCNALA